jgi:DHA2 family multidrug resistance protein
VFYINVPIGALAISGIYIFMSRDRGGLQRPFDFLGFGALVAFVASFQLMTDRGPTQDWFGSKEIWTYAIVAMVGFYVFIVQTLTAEHPFFHRDLAKDRNFVACSAFGVCVGALLFSTTALLPSFMQNLLGYSAYQAGLASMPRGVGSLVAFLGVPYLIRLIGARRVLACGIAISITALWMMAHFNLQMTAGPIMTSGVIQGFGTGLLFAPLNSLSYVSLNPVHRTEGTIVATMARSLGSSLGISMMSATLVSDSALAHARLADRINCGDPVLGATLPGALNPCTGSIAAFNGEVTRQAAMIGYDTIFAWMALFTLLLLPLLLLMRPPPPATMVAIETPAE